MALFHSIGKYMQNPFTALFDHIIECGIALVLIVMFAAGSASAAPADENRNGTEQLKKDEMMLFMLVMWDEGAPENSINIPSAYAKLDYCNEAAEFITADVHATSGRIRRWLCRAEFTSNQELIYLLEADIKRRDKKSR